MLCRTRGSKCQFLFARRFIDMQIETGNMHPPAFITVKRTDMNTKLLFLLLLLTGSIIGCRSGKEEKNNNLSTAEHDITGKWVRIGQNGPVAFDFKAIFLRIVIFNPT